MRLADVLTGAGLVGIGTGQAAAEHDAFGGSTLLVTGVLNLLAAQEANRAAAVRVADNEAMRALIGEAATDYPDVILPDVAADLTLTALDTEGAALRTAIIALHTAVEARDDTPRDRAILAFYRASAARSELQWPI